jgi:hypothetical protein
MQQEKLTGQHYQKLSIAGLSTVHNKERLSVVSGP